MDIEQDYLEIGDALLFPNSNGEYQLGIVDGFSEDCITVSWGDVQQDILRSSIVGLKKRDFEPGLGQLFGQTFKSLEEASDKLRTHWKGLIYGL